MFKSQRSSPLAGSRRPVDFLTVGYPESCDGHRIMAALTLLAGRLNIPLAKHTCVGPVACLEYLEIILDNWKMEERLPLEKGPRIIQFINPLFGRSSCTIWSSFNCGGILISHHE